MTTTASSSEIEQRYHAAVGIAREAGAIAARTFRGLKRMKVQSKGLQDYVTNADREVEAFIRDALKRAYPDDEFLGEEGGGKLGRAVWVVDPIDGTSNFLRRIPFFCVSIAFVLDGEIEVGVIYDPIGEELFAAHRGVGAVLNGEPIKVSRCARLDKAMIGLSSSYRTSSEPYLGVTRRLFEKKSDSRRLGSAALGLAYVASGRLDGFWELHLNSWDVMAGLLLVREAGGWTNDFLEGDGLLRGGPVLACPPSLGEILRKTTGIQ